MGLWVYVRYAWRAPSFVYHHGTDEYEVLSPRMLGVALLAPYFLWMIGRSLADLPLVQRVASVLLRIAFVATLALGLARIGRSGSTM